MRRIRLSTQQFWALPVVELYVRPAVGMTAAIGAGYLMLHAINKSPFVLSSDWPLVTVWFSVFSVASGLVVSALVADGDPRERSGDEVTARQVTQYLTRTMAPRVILFVGLVIALLLPERPQVPILVLTVGAYGLLSWLHWSAVYGRELEEAALRVLRTRTRLRAIERQERCRQLTGSSVPVPTRMAEILLGWLTYSLSIPVALAVAWMCSSVLSVSIVASYLVASVTLGLPAAITSLVVFNSVRYARARLDILDSLLFAWMYTCATFVVGLSMAVIVANRCGMWWVLIQMASTISASVFLFKLNVRAAERAQPKWWTPLASGWHRRAALNDEQSAGVDPVV
ncbi:hypothetical protein M1C59_17275 [Gordonia terrae]|uniref:hypothetical protein n=1 Tax=Gordonia terrae TaxID=2055 RepID=UPI00200A106F|nr:hypothetical protein [Gordonia terrae]UPW07806.1 hypothetical protein M1C59_17275 [Gordonia terrae]